ncbi:saccharopine dehydrogenase-like oxidoreductase [Pelobates cultripes]|uniref:Saccharopine dehydrogenase-like oxidoreductase n=1 Tax=Pelobates cultripes TaxID=61616 RepID=A0AAD1RDS9_PELCU|nr:saccharopine dehydrogenase-like oxidoreductase [Pelobates cultripes]
MASEAPATTRQYQFVVFGASGFTGRYVVEELARVMSEGEAKTPKLRWAVAGRSQVKLEEIVARLARKIGKPHLKSEIGIIICDVDDYATLTRMCKKAAIVLNCVGPYTLYGEPVIKACIENGANYLDLCGEPQFLEEMYLKYDKKAAEKGVYIVGSTLTAVESFFYNVPESVIYHNGSWKSFVHGIGYQNSLKKIKNQMSHKPLPVFCKTLKRDPGLYAIPLLGADTSVVTRTQRYLYEHLQESPVYYSANVAVSSFVSAVLLTFAVFLMSLLATFSWGRNILINYPRFFSCGTFSTEGPTQRQIDETSFKIKFIGEGCSKGKDGQKDIPDLKICTEVSGPEAAYVTTPIVIVQAAMTIFKEPGALPKGGGVLSPGAALSKTRIIDRLRKAGLHFDIKN